jgi:ABC-type nitrate/sulfonate/bicarbonate transport system permease component
VTATGSVTPTTTPTSVTAPTPRPSRKNRYGRRRVYSRKQRWIIGVINLAVFFTLWQITAEYTDVPRLFLPSVTEVWDAVVRMHEQGILWGNLGISLWIYLVGMVISIVIAVPLGLFIGGVKVVDRILSPYIWAIYTTPRLILMPLVVLWVGINDTARVVIIVLSAVPATLVVVMEGVKTVDNSLVKAARTFGASRFQLFKSVVFPATIPFIATGIRMGVSRGLIGLFIGELFTAANGIGYIIALSSKTFNSAQTYAMLLLFVLFCVAMVGLTQLLERKASVWRA